MRRWLYPAAAAVCAALCALGAARPPDPGPVVDAPGVPAVKIGNPDAHVRLAAQFVATREFHRQFGEKDLPYVRFLSWYDADDPEQLEEDVDFANFWLQQLSFEAATEPMHEVPGSKGRLFWLDYRDYRWNSAAWQAVAERDFVFLEPAIDHAHAEYLRQVLCAPVSKKAAGGREVLGLPNVVKVEKVLPVEAVVYGPQFVRDTLETNRAPSYYDLLFAAQRFRKGGAAGRDAGPGRPTLKVSGGASFIARAAKITLRVPQGARAWLDGEQVRSDGPVRSLATPDLINAGSYGLRVEVADYPAASARIPVRPGRETVVEWCPPERARHANAGDYEFVDFPATVADFEKAFGVDKTRLFAREQRIDLDFGAVVAGGADFPGEGSAVALNNRLLVFVRGPVGPYFETYDVKKSVRERNFSEVLIFGLGRRFRRGDGVVAVRDAGELLAGLPNGGQAGLLVNGQGKRIEFAVEVAQDTADPHMNIGVRNYGSCLVCHGPKGGFIKPADMIAAGIKAGVDIKYLDRDQRNRARGFFLGWEAQLRGYNDPYLALLEKMTSNNGQKKGWTGARLGAYVVAFRHRYDAPVGAKRAAQLVGVPEEVYGRLAVKLTLNGPKRTVQGLKVPRSAWDSDYYLPLQIMRQAEVDETAAKARAREAGLERVYREAYRKAGRN